MLKAGDILIVSSLGLCLHLGCQFVLSFRIAMGGNLSNA